MLPVNIEYGSIENGTSKTGTSYRLNVTGSLVDVPVSNVTVFFRSIPLENKRKKNRKEEKHKKVENEFGAKDQQKPLRMSTNKLMRNYEKGFKGQEKPNKI